MLYRSLVAEIVSLLLIIVLAINVGDRKRAVTSGDRRFKACLFCSAFSVIWDMVCVILPSRKGGLSVGVNMVINTIYFNVIVLTCSIIAFYIFEKMLEHVYDQFCICRAKRVLISLNAAFAVLTVVNVKYGLLFWFDEDGVYQRGALNWAGYGLMLVELILLFVCYARHKGSVSKEVKHALKTLPPVILTLLFIQLSDSSLLLNGTIAALVNFILFISIYSQKRESDSVTGIGNRDSFFSELTLRIAGRQKFQVILIVLRDFGAVNQRYGHRVGNEFLYAMARWIEQNYEDAKAFRYIGVTCAVVLPYAGEEQAAEYVKSIRRRFGQEWCVGQWKENVPTSVCDLICAEGELKADEAMEILDYMLSSVKHTYQKHLHFNRQVSAEFLRKRKVADRVRKAVKERLFEVWYQPAYCHKEKRFCAAEALVRLKDEEGRFISPGEFIPIAEEIGLVNHVFWQVLNQVCTFLADNPKLSMSAVSINVSMSQFEEPDLLKEIKTMVQSYKLTADRIKFEITERVISEDGSRVQDIIRQMINEGFGFYLDDFGTGYSNFALVTQYNFECIKLDRKMIQMVEEDEKNAILVSSLVSLFHKLGIEVIAEGTETRAQVAKLIELGADEIQGYYYARPMPEGLLLEFLKEETDEKR